MTQNLDVTTNDVRGPGGSPVGSLIPTSALYGDVGLSIEMAADIAAATSNVHSPREISMAVGSVVRNIS